MVEVLLWSSAGADVVLEVVVDLFAACDFNVVGDAADVDLGGVCKGKLSPVVEARCKRD